VVDILKRLIHKGQVHAEKLIARYLTQDSIITLSNTLSDPHSNFHPQGLGYDPVANELLFIQQSDRSIRRTDMAGNLVGSVSVNLHHTTSVASDGTNYYVSDYTSNSGGLDLHRVTSSGSVTNISSERASYGGYPIDVRGGIIYRTNHSNSYNWSNLSQVRVASLSSPDSITSTINLNGTNGIGDIAVDDVSGNIWIIDYSNNASLRRFDMSGNQLDSFALGLDGLDAGITYANGKLYYYDWKSGSGSTLTTFTINGVASSTAIPEPSTWLLMVLSAALVVRRTRK
jgi:hypothetical protein